MQIVSTYRVFSSDFEFHEDHTVALSCQAGERSLKQPCQKLRNLVPRMTQAPKEQTTSPPESLKCRGHPESLGLHLLRELDIAKPYPHGASQPEPTRPQIRHPKRPVVCRSLLSAAHATRQPELRAKRGCSVRVLMGSLQKLIGLLGHIQYNQKFRYMQYSVQAVGT